MRTKDVNLSLSSFFFSQPSLHSELSFFVFVFSLPNGDKTTDPIGL